MEDLPERIERAFERCSSRASNLTEVKVNAGGLGVWVCSICCAAMPMQCKEVEQAEVMEKFIPLIR